MHAQYANTHAQYTNMQAQYAIMQAQYTNMQEQYACMYSMPTCRHNMSTCKHNIPTYSMPTCRHNIYACVYSMSTCRQNMPTWMYNMHHACKTCQHVGTICQHAICMQRYQRAGTTCMCICNMPTWMHNMTWTICSTTTCMPCPCRFTYYTYRLFLKVHSSKFIKINPRRIWIGFRPHAHACTYRHITGNLSPNIQGDDYIMWWQQNNNNKTSYWAILKIVSTAKQYRSIP